MAVVAAGQAAPVFLDRDATVEKVARLTKEAVAHSAELVAFPEAFVPGYPDWVWRTTPWADRDWYARWADQAVDIPSAAFDCLCEIGFVARRHVIETCSRWRWKGRRRGNEKAVDLGGARPFRPVKSDVRQLRP